jgi:hypothetical protein
MNLFETFTQSLADENNIDTTTAQKITNWLESEGVLDHEIMKETYLHD